MFASNLIERSRSIKRDYFMIKFSLLMKWTLELCSSSAYIRIEPSSNQSYFQPETELFVGTSTPSQPYHKLHQGCILLKGRSKQLLARYCTFKRLYDPNGKSRCKVETNVHALLGQPLVSQEVEVSWERSTRFYAKPRRLSNLRLDHLGHTGAFISFNGEISCLITL